MIRKHEHRQFFLTALALAFVLLLLMFSLCACGPQTASDGNAYASAGNVYASGGNAYVYASAGEAGAPAPTPHGQP